MLSLPRSVQIHLARGATDMRKQIDGLAGMVMQVLGEDPFSGHLFVFCNRRRNRIKILNWESSGYWLLHKRLEKGTFAWPLEASRDEPSITMSAAELSALHRLLRSRLTYCHQARSATQLALSNQE